MRDSAANPFSDDRARRLWIQSAWPQPGVIAARHFQQDGRGYILLDMINADQLNSDTAMVNVRYVAEGSALFETNCGTLRADGPEAEAALINAVAQYDPAREIVLLACLPDRAMLYRQAFGAALPTPAQSFAASLIQSLLAQAAASQN